MFEINTNMWVSKWRH